VVIFVILHAIEQRLLDNVASMAWKLHAIEQIASMAWGRPKFDSHTDLHSASVFHGAVRPPSGRLPA